MKQRLSLHSASLVKIIGFDTNALLMDFSSAHWRDATQGL
jgi:hypothetical protein